MTDRIEGLWAAIPTPLTEAGTVDHAVLVRHAHWLAGEGCDGFVPFGTTGEGPSFSAKERLDAVEAMLAGGIAPERIALGTGCPAVADTVALTRGALALGLRHALVLPPYFFRDADAQGIEDAFAAVIDGVGDGRLRLTLYNIPQVAGIGVPPGVLARLRARYGAVVAGLKDSSGDFAQFRAYRRAAPDAAVTVGNEPDIGRALAEGGTGTICGMVNLVPGLVRAMFRDPPEPEPMRRAVALIQGGAFLPVFKSVLAALTGHMGWLRVRPPLCPADAALGARAAQAMRRGGLQAAE